MMPPMTTSCAVAEGIDVDLDGLVEELVDQDRVLRARPRRHASCIAQLVRRRRRSPWPARPGRRRDAPPPGSRCGRRPSPPPRRSGPVPFSGCLRSSLCSRAWKRSRSSARSMASGLSADDRHAGLFQGRGQLQRRLAAELDDDPVRLLDRDDLQHVLQGQRLEVEPVGGVVVGGNGLRVAVDHDRFVAVLGQGKTPWTQQ